MMEMESGSTLHNSSVGFSSFPIFPSINVSRIEERSEVPRVGDIWIPKVYIFPDCFIKIFISRIEKLLQVGDMILRMDTRRSTSRFISWRLCSKLDQGLKWQWRVRMNNPMPFIFLTFSIPRLKEDKSISFHKMLQQD